MQGNPRSERLAWEERFAVSLCVSCCHPWSVDILVQGLCEAHSFAPTHPPGEGLPFGKTVRDAPAIPYRGRVERAWSAGLGRFSDTSLVSFVSAQSQMWHDDHVGNLRWQSRHTRRKCRQLTYISGRATVRDVSAIPHRSHEGRARSAGMGRFGDTSTDGGTLPLAPTGARPFDEVSVSLTLTEPISNYKSVDGARELAAAEIGRIVNTDFVKHYDSWDELLRGERKIVIAKLACNIKIIPDLSRNVRMIADLWHNGYNRFIRYAGPYHVLAYTVQRSVNRGASCDNPMFATPAGTQPTKMLTKNSPRKVGTHWLTTLELDLWQIAYIGRWGSGSIERYVAETAAYCSAVFTAAAGFTLSRPSGKSPGSTHWWEVQDALLSLRAAESAVNGLRHKLQQQAEHTKDTGQAQVSRLGDLELKTSALEAAGKGSQQADTETDYYVVNLGIGVFHKIKSRYVRRTKCGRLNKARVPMGLNRC